MRADSLRQTDNLSRLHDRYTEAERKVALHEAEEAALRSQLKASEATIQKLKEEAARARKLVAETRAACANEVRKRDRQIDGLKKAVTDAGRARGERKGNTITTIQVAGEIGAEDMNAGASTMDDGYNLRHETNGFLAQLAKSLSEENEALLGLIRKTGDSLKDMSGWEKQQDAAGKKGDSSAVVLVTSPEDMAADMTTVLEHLRTLLTNPSFVPLEEVVVREEEIFRLRDGWEKMETRWRDAVHLIDSWRRRMAAGGHPVDMEDLKMGLRLSPVRIQDMEQIGDNDPFQLSTLQEEEEEEERGHGEVDDDDEEEDEEYAQEEEQMDFKPEVRPSREGSLHLVPAPGYADMVPEYEEAQDDINDSDGESSIFQDDVEDIDMDELQASEPNIEILHHSTGLPDDTDSTTLPPPPKITPLEETAISGNRKPAARLTEKSKKRSSELMRDTLTDDAKAPPPPPPHRVKEGESPQKRLKVSAEGQNDKPKSRPNSAIFTDPGSSLGSDLQAKATPESSVSKASSKTTVKSVRSDVSAKKDTPTQSKPSTRATRAAAAQVQEKKDTPTRAITRQKSTRAIAATNASSARSAASRQETTKTRAPAPTSSRAEMPPPPRPSKSTPSNDKTLRPPPPQHDDKKPSPREKPQPASVNTSAPAETSSSSSAKRPAAPAPESPTRSPGKTGSSRLPLPRNVAPPPQQSPLTMARIAAKLAASEREADAARVRAKLRAARLKKGGGSSSSAGSGLAPSSTAGGSSTSTVASSRVASGGSAPGDPVKKDLRAVSAESAATGMSGSFSTDENGLRGGVSVLGGAGDDNDNNDESASSSLTAAAPGPIAKDRSPRGGVAPSSPRKATGATSPTKASSAAAASPAKPPAGRKREVRSRAAKAANRRRSTLSPWELQSLIAGEVVPPTPSVQVVAPQQGEGE